jgi:hypothetical protein
VDEVKKKHILLSLNSELAQKLETLLSECAVELYTDELAKDSYDFVFEENASYEIEAQEKVIVFSDEVENCKHSYISPSLLDSEVIQIALKRCIGEDSTMDLETQVSGSCKSFKITDPFSIGHYLDVATSTSYKEVGDFENISKAFVQVSNFYMSQLKALPLDVEMIISNEMKVLQFHAPITDFSNTNIPDEVFSVLGASLVDVYFLEKSKELVISVSWFGEEGKVSYLKHHLNGFRKPSPNKDVYNGFDKLLGLDKEDIEFKTSPEQEDVKRSSFALVKKVIDFVKSKKDSNPDLFEFQSALAEYPNKEVIAGLVEEDIDFIKKAIESYNVYDTINSTVKGNVDEALKQDDIAQKVSGALMEMESFEAIGMFDSEEDAIQKISGITDNLTEESTLVNDFAQDLDAVTKVEGSPEEAEENQLVKGSKEEIKEENTIISGSRENIDDTWKVKRSEIAERVKEEVQKLVSAGNHTPEDIQDRIKSVLKDELGLDDKTAGEFNDSLLSAVSTNSVGESIAGSDSAEVFLRLDNERLKGQLASKMDQIVRMKRIIDTMKADFIAKKEAEKALYDKIKEEGADSIEAKFKAAEVQIAALLKEINLKEKREEQLVQGQEHALKNKEHRIGLLEEKIADMTEKQLSMSDNGETKARVNELELENKNLTNQLKVTNERFEAISEKYEKEVGSSSPQFQANDSGLQSLLEKEKEKVAGLQVQINEFKKQLATKAAEESAQAAAPTQTAEDPGRIKELEVQLKASELETKKFEQKIKFMSSQMSEMEKKLKKMASRAGGGAKKGGSDLNTKRLEKNLEKINALNDKLQADMTDKKKELHKAKQENSIMHNKITELERKLAKYEKKAA